MKEKPAGRDNDGRPIIVLRNANEKTFDNKGKKSGNLVNLVYNIERAVASIDLTKSPDQKWVIVLDFNGCVFSIIFIPI